MMHSQFMCLKTGPVSGVENVLPRYRHEWVRFWIKLTNYKHFNEFANIWHGEAVVVVGDGIVMSPERRTPLLLTCMCEHA